MLSDPFYTNPFDFERFTEKMHTLSQMYPNIRLFSAGHSVLGKPIWCLFAGDCSCAPVLLAGGIHGAEWLTSMLLFLFGETLAKAAINGDTIAGIRADGTLAHHSLILLPCLNPDGIDIAINGFDAAEEYAPQVKQMIFEHPEQVWQANVRGVDLNHNFDAGWETLQKLERQAGITAPGPTRYGGNTPFSEPETRAIRDLCTKYDIRQLFSFHSQGEEIYWRYGYRTPGRSRLIAGLLASSSDYTVCDPVGLASHGGMKDWFIQETGRPGFTVEIGKGKNPLPIEQLPDIWERLQEMLMLSILV